MKYGTITTSFYKKEQFEISNSDIKNYRSTSTSYRVVGFGDTPTKSLKDLISKIDDLFQDSNVGGVEPVEGESVGVVPRDR